MKKIRIITAFPEFYDSPLKTSMFQRAQDKHLICFEVHNLRDYTKDRHRTVDDKPFGGGPGMVFKPEPLFYAIKSIKEKTSKTKVIYLSPKGRVFKSCIARQYAQLDDMTIICGHYEGIDQRIIDNMIDDEVSIGDYILTGGEVASLVFMDAFLRFIPGVLGNTGSLDNESFEDNLLDFPHYTRPCEFFGSRVPDVLLSGNHKEIERWRREQSVRITKKRRPDLIGDENV